MALGLSAGIASPAYAADPVADPLSSVSTNINVTNRVISVMIGKSTFLDLKADARDVIVTNPGVVQATIRSERKMMLLGLNEGETQVYVMDAEGRRITSYLIQVARDTGRLEEVLREVIPGSTIKTKMVGHSVILSGEVDNDMQAKQAVDIATAYLGASVRSPDAGGGSSVSTGGAAEASLGPVISALTIKGRDQVMLKVTIAEIQRNVLKQLGINSTGSWTLQDATINAATSSVFPVAGSSLAKSALSATWGSGDTISLQAMEQAGVAHTLAEPTLTAISGESANFLVGGEMPVPSGTSCSDDSGSCQPTITYKKFGVSLSFTPVVLSSGKINLKVGTEVSEIDPSNQIIVPAGKDQSLAIPGFKVRKQDTTVEMPSGAALVTAGLIQQQTKQAVNGLPGLMNLPVLGALFRSRDFQKQETELLIVVTPYIAKPVSPQKIARPDDGFVPASEPSAAFLGQMNRKNTQKKTAKPLYKQPGFIIN
ncbi:type II and III secretion system protein family protein [Microvirga sp. BT688]|uniref:type II and III secretion system protein family protein n=1 Tax=Microvirga sp. TaxID=1873136 RepID=UPI00168A16DA|nr:type II and III secretion system protein family protein [Microvirga sp.]MBD2745780.1 type II and III secretion system protein family protein [Microvirga sp.]